ncbi:TetR/AcrR family transcriptional regulator [Marinactinospora thermotolerans]|uniref:Transcriptional regulator, TetR family n=1 Tax=Marinactinospora thermotolerans DSM 45154 TaxID=1122192 RepID=A0A1T4LKG8_9ACTN|nr:TetR/AcrR family transcriptional regulator [Marinactinospora thermotolerans]SJZ55240.1 transcriptional regulator, TetR family [Marinactinospora thermotolerans DSM 45154]
MGTTGPTAMDVHEGAERAGRAARILDSASELLVAWGYRRVTIDEVARHADVGKGTVYLHWRTKEALFLAVLLRAKRRIVGARANAMRHDPGEALPSRMVRAMYVDLHADPVARALYTGDSRLLGQLSRISNERLRGLTDEGVITLDRHLGILREHGLVRVDSDVRHQEYALKATTLGFLMLDPFLPDQASMGIEERADGLEATVRAALERPGDPAALAAAAPPIAALYARLDRLCREEIRRQLRE